MNIIKSIEFPFAQNAQAHPYFRLNTPKLKTHSEYKQWTSITLIKCRKTAVFGTKPVCRTAKKTFPLWRAGRSYPV